MANKYSLGIDVGSTTVKTVITDSDGNILYSKYQRHLSKVKETVTDQLKIIQADYPDEEFTVCITGSAGLGLANSADIPFVQEVHAAFLAVKQKQPDADAVIELGGEDAKIIFLTGGVEQRMNGTCAGGTGAFIDQMATLLGVSADQLDELSLHAQKIYPIASRCGVFAKSDIQPLLNQGARREDVAASIFQAVVDQTVSGLAQGRSIEGKVLFLGGPLFFLRGLKKAFVRTLGLDDEHAVFPPEAPVFVAYGCAIYAATAEKAFHISDIIEKIRTAKASDAIVTGEPLFRSHAEYDEFIDRHKKFDLGYADIRTYKGDAYLGIDAGSTTTKLVLITEDGRILYHHYSSNLGQPLDKIANQVKRIYSEMNPNITIKGSAVTGYGEDLIKAGLSVDHGIVETVAHFKAAAYFCPDVDFIIDIGGQDIKCFKIKNKSIDSIMLNEACSSGCGSFIQTFAMALGYDIAEFSQLGLFAEHPVDLGSRCTVFMNSSVKQAQKDGATVEDISAGLSSSIIKNAIYKVIRANSPDDLGKNIVVQGGTFLNDAVLRSFEKELGRNVIRPAISGLMGAFGCALYAKERAGEEASKLISAEELENFTYTSRSANCGGCTAHCQLNIISFGKGRRFISGNRCEKGGGAANRNTVPNLYEFKYDSILNTVKTHQPRRFRGTVGLPLALGFYEQLPFWHMLFTTLGFRTVVSDESSRDMYYLGQHTIPSDTVCYPAKLTHGHIENLLDKGVDFIFYPCMSYNLDEGGSDNHFNCPVVAYYPELLMANNPRLNKENFIHPYLDLNIRKNVIKVLGKALSRYNVKGRIPDAVDKAYEALQAYHNSVTKKAMEIITQARAEGRKIIVIAGRPYHIDKEINHGIHKLVSSLGMAVITEDSISGFSSTPKLGVLNQWTYHSRLYRAAKYVTTQPDMQLIQLVSFGCGIDAVTGDEVRHILESRGKLYTQLKIDEINNLGAARIRLRSLVAAMEQAEQKPAKKPQVQTV
ncbi:acyl-CoA dehydratase activase [Ruminococcus flavefaciens]|uniref:acyl-CoA dehydratase activase n=1 Tax=Ruminococcus flavefaciens TaxID=1265 RepID=UPI0013DC959E|nr:acyl-CoA dehydratase activase [Ruminococcus flavefaciens]